MTRREHLICGGEACYHDDSAGEHMQLDEVCVPTPAHVHVERMAANHVWLGITGADGTVAHIDVYADRASVRMHVYEGEVGGPQHERRAAIAEARATDADRRAAAWVTGSTCHTREARRAAAWAEFLSSGILRAEDAPPPPAAPTRSWFAEEVR